MIDVQAIREAKRELDRLHDEINRTNQRISQLAKSAEAYERLAKRKAQEAADAPFGSKLTHMQLAAYYVKEADKARIDLEIWEQRHRDAIAQLHTAADNYDEVREDLPEDIDQRVELMEKYELEWLFSAEDWVIDPLDCSLETFEMLCDLQRRTNDVLWNHFCKDNYEWDLEDLEEVSMQWQCDRLAHAEAFVWNCRIDSDWYDQRDFEEVALETPVVEFQDRLWDFFDEAREEGDRLEEEAKPEVKCLSEDMDPETLRKSVFDPEGKNAVVSVDVGYPSNTFTIYEPNPEVLKLFSPEPISDEVKALYFGDEVISFSDFTELTGVKRREGVTFEEVEGWVKENSAQIPGLDSSSEMNMEKLFRALFGRES